jgi:UDP-N-acetylglucosamine 1-carboxyvinyltransferase
MFVEAHEINVQEYSNIVLQPGRLTGRVQIAGAKNSALRLLAASLLTRERLRLKNFPVELLDAQIHIEMLRTLGKTCHLTGPETLEICESSPLLSRLDWQGRSIRNTLLILGALVAREGAGAVPLPGGCKLGERKYDLHELVLRTLGAEVWTEGETLCATAPKGLIGAEVYLPLRSTGATENAILTASLARGVSRIWNPHIRPEILDLISCLQAMGAQIRVFGQEHIEVTGVEGLNGAEHHVIPDNMEAITWIAAAVITRGDIEIAGFPARDLEVVMAHLRASGAHTYTGENSLIVRGGHCYPLEISTGPHPGINSDVQPILAAWAAHAKGESRIIDLRFPGRYGYATEMGRMGLRYEIVGDMLKIQGQGGGLRGAEVRALDLRAGAALTLCALAADGETTITDAWQIRRGYVGFAEKLRALGAHAEWQ